MFCGDADCVYYNCAACDSQCNSCVVRGAGKCDETKCKIGFGLTQTYVCDRESCFIPLTISGVQISSIEGMKSESFKSTKKINFICDRSLANCLAKSACVIVHKKANFIKTSFTSYVCVFRSDKTQSGFLMAKRTMIMAKKNCSMVVFYSRTYFCFNMPMTYEINLIKLAYFFKKKCTLVIVWYCISCHV